MPDSYFIKNQNEAFHDSFLYNLIREEKVNNTEPLDMTEFVKILDFDRRWTY